MCVRERERERLNVKVCAEGLVYPSRVCFVKNAANSSALTQTPTEKKSKLKLTAQNRWKQFVLIPIQPQHNRQLILVNSLKMV